MSCLYIPARQDQASGSRYPKSVTESTVKVMEASGIMSGEMTGSKTARRMFLYWFPVILLPLSNLIVARAAQEPLTLSAALILGAAAEELFFRFFLLRQVFLRTMKPVSAIVIVSILFAGMHLFNLRTGQPPDITLLQTGCAFAFGIWAGAVTWKSTWLIPLLAHVLINMTAGADVTWVSLALSMAVLADGMILTCE